METKKSVLSGIKKLEKPALFYIIIKKNKAV
jgi:hypothetical protein